MPASARKSSLGVNRRALPKAHIPYRGDNPKVGKKTGIAIKDVERKSDGFEPFDEILGQADKRTPPRLKKRKSSMAGRRYRDFDSDEEDEEEQGYDDDEYGEMSMDVDSPIHQAAHTRAPTTPTNGRTSRPVARTSSVDFDKIPSPRNNSRSLSMANRAGPSKLRRSMIPEDREPSSEPGEQFQGDDSGEMDMTMTMSVANTNMSVGVARGRQDSMYGAPTTAGGESPQQNSFTQMDQDEDDDDEHFPFIEPEALLEPTPEPEPEDPEPTPTPPPQPSKKGKGKARDPSPQMQDDWGMEEDIAHGLQELDQNQPSDGDEPEPELEPKKKKLKVKLSDQEPPSRTRTKSANKKENRPSREGVRRSNRNHYGPLEWWRGEKVVYGRLDFEEPVLVPEIREIIRIPKETPEPLTQKRKRGRSRSRTVQPRGTTADPEAGWDEGTKPDAMVLDYVNGEEVEKRIAWRAAKVKPQLVPNGDWLYEKILWDSDFIAAGQLVIPPKCRKPSKATKDNTYIFYVIEGAVNLKIHDTSLVLATGAMFMVPRGNTYFIENISQRDARLFFTQARKTMTNEEERVVALANRQKRRSRRSSSAGPLYAHARRGEGSKGVEGGTGGQQDDEEGEEGEGEGGETPKPKSKPKKGRVAPKA